MGTIMVTEFMSVDGVMQSPGGEPGFKHSGWVGRFDDTGQFDYKLAEVLNSDGLLIGRVTYESFAGAWPERDGEFADKMNAMPKFVVSRTLTNPTWNNSTVLNGDVVTSVRALKESFDGEIMVAGSRTLVHTLREHALIDEYHLMIFPIVLGSGDRLWNDVPDAATMQLANVRSFDSGIVLLSYRVVRDSPARPGL